MERAIGRYSPSFVLEPGLIAVERPSQAFFLSPIDQTVQINFSGEGTIDGPEFSRSQPKAMLFAVKLSNMVIHNTMSLAKVICASQVAFVIGSASMHKDNQR